MKLSVWRLCWISGGYRLEAASRPIALYIVGIRGAQGRSQHYKSGTGTLVESESWLAMADCLGRFGRASHSNPRYHSPTQFFLGKSKCMSTAILAITSGCAVHHLHTSCHPARPTAICSRLVEPTRPILSSFVEHYKTCAVRPREFSCRSWPCSQRCSPAGPLCSSLGVGSNPVFGARSLASTSPRYVRNKT